MTVKISDYTALTSAASGDLLEIVDISDTTMAATGTNKKIVLSDLLASVLPLAGGTMTGTITSTLGSITDPKSFLDATATWNDPADTFYGIFQNITVTAAHANSRFIELQNAGAVKFSVDKDGLVTLAGGITDSADTLPFTVNGTNFWSLKGGGAFPKFLLRSNAGVSWTGTNMAVAPTVGIGKIDDDTLCVFDADNALTNYKDWITRVLKVAPQGSNGQSINYGSLTELTTIAAGATTDTTIQLPAKAIIDAVAVRVTTAIPTAANFTVGDSGSAARFSTAAVSSAANSTDEGTKAGAYYNATATSVRITPDLTPAANTGRVRVTIFYHYVTVPTS